MYLGSCVCRVYRKAVTSFPGVSEEHGNEAKKAIASFLGVSGEHGNEARKAVIPAA